MTLHDIAEINPKTDVRHLRDDDLVSFIPMSDLTDDGRWLGDDTRTLRSVRHGYTAFAEGDVLFAKITPCMENGKGACVKRLRNGVGFGSTEYHVLRARAESDADFVYQWTKFRELRGNAANAMTGSAGQQRVPSAFIAQYPITEHGADERSKIAAVLSKLDDAIEQTEALLAKQQRIKTGLMHDLLTRGLDAQGRLRDPSTHRFKKSPLGLIPEEWEVKSLDWFLKGIEAGKSPNCEDRPAGANEWGVLKVSAVSANGFVSAENKTLPSGIVPNPKWRVKNGDLLIQRSNTFELVGTVCLVTSTPDNLLLCDKTLRLDVDTKRGDKRYLLATLKSPEVRNQIEMAATGSSGSMKNIGQHSINSFWLKSPASLNEQIMIGDKLESFDRALKQSTDQLTKLRRLKTGLMHDLLTGRVAVTPLLGGKKAAGAA